MAAVQKISGREALLAGVRLIAREPAAFAVWCVLTFAIGVVPQMLSIGASLQMLGAVASGGAMSTPEVMAAQQRVMAYQPLIYLSSLALIALVPSAIFRAILRPDDRAFLYLRLGAREFWLALIVIVMFVMYFIAILVGMIPFLIVIGIVAAASAVGGDGGGGAAVGALIGALSILVLIVVILWGALRLSFAPVMAFADGTFRLFESWTLTRGHAGKMLLVAAAITFLSSIVYVVVLGVLVMTLGLDFASLGATLSSDPQALLNQIGVPWLALAIVAASVLTAAYYVVWGAAWAEMYRQLRPGVAETFA
jgi:hypothetical protein